MAQKDLRAGTDWSPTIRAAIADSRFVLLLLTRRSHGKHWISVETGAAWALGKTTIPLLNQVSPSEITEPLSRSQARPVENAQQQRDLAKELAELNARSG